MTAPRLCLACEGRAVNCPYCERAPEPDEGTIDTAGDTETRDDDAPTVSAYPRQAPDVDEFGRAVESGDHVFPDGIHMVRVGKKAAGRVLDGRTWDEVPA